MRRTLLMDVILTMLVVRGGLVLSQKHTRRRASGEDKRDIDLMFIGPLVRRDAPSDPISKADSDACAREAAAAIEAVLARRCPKLKQPFWNAIDKLYRLDNPPGPRMPGRIRQDCYSDGSRQPRIRGPRVLRAAGEPGTG